MTQRYNLKSHRYDQHKTEKNTLERFEQGMLTIKLKNLPGHRKRLN